MIQAFLVAGLLFGDEGKGTTVDFLTRQYDAKTIVRYQGADQAAHNNVLPDGRYHCHAQLGSGMFLPWVETYLSEHMIVNPVSLVNEAEIFSKKAKANVFPRIIINPDCLVITPIHMQINRAREILRGDCRHGTCGRGVGETAKDRDQWFAIQIKDLFNPKALREKLMALRASRMDIIKSIKEEYGSNQFLVHEIVSKFSDEYMMKLMDFYKDFVSSYGIRFEDSQYLKNVFQNEEKVIFEGAQGVLLDVDYGFKPHVTKTKTTFENADVILDMIGYSGKRCRLGISRAYATRHGHGPFPTHDSELTRHMPEMHNKTNEWQGEFRIGWLDKLLLKYAMEVCGGVDRLIITNVDRLSILNEIKVCTSYSFPNCSYGQNITSIQELKKDINILGNSSLTEKLMKIKPNYEIYHNIGPNNIHTFIEEMLDIPVGIVSSGPTFKDKQLTQNL